MFPSNANAPQYRLCKTAHPSSHIVHTHSVGEHVNRVSSSGSRPIGHASGPGAHWLWPGFLVFACQSFSLPRFVG